MAGSSWNVFVPATKAKSSEVNANFDWIEGHIVPMNAGFQTDGTYDIGSATARWKDAYFSGIGRFDTRLKAGLDATSSTGFFIGKQGSNIDLLFSGNTAFTTTAVSINAINDNNSANIPLEIRASKTRLTTGDFALADTSTAISEFSTDGTLAGNSDLAVPTEKAVKTYVDSLVGLLVKGYPSSSTGGQITLNEVYDKNSEFSSSSFVPNTNGTYEVVADFYFGAATTTTEAITLSFIINNTVTSDHRIALVGLGGSGNITASNVMSMTAGQTLTMNMAGVGSLVPGAAPGTRSASNFYIKRIA